jgi:hypothetical protein
MLYLRGLLDRLLLVGAVVAGGLVPGFISQYRQRLGGRLDQARLDLEPWQKIADQYHHGNIAELIQYNLASSDGTFHSEGLVVQALVAGVDQLQRAADALQGNLLSQLGYLALHADGGLAHATLQDWVPTFALSAEGLVFAMLFGVAVWLVFQASWWLVARARLRPRRRSRPYA